MSKLKVFLIYYLPALIWAGIIFYFSSISGLKYSQSSIEETFLRKGAHFFEFAVLSFLLWRIFYIRNRLSARKAFFWSLFISAIYGFSDEFHQTFVMGRTGKFIDAFFDFSSSMVVLESIVIFVRKKINWKNVLIIISSLILIFGLGARMIQKAVKLENGENAAVSLENQENENGNIIQRILDNNSADNSESPSQSTDIPSKISIKVPFTSQAPFANWDAYHEEACEEASLIMAKYYLDGKKLTPEVAEQEIQSMVAFEIKNYGFYEDTNTEDTVKLAKDFYRMNNLEIVYDFSENDIEKYLSQGHPIIIPAAGQMLGNPYFSGDGPPYHMLVLTGYNKNTIITNDPGTKRGEGYKYDLDILYNAIHDFTGNIDTIRQGRKAMIIVK